MPRRCHPERQPAANTAWQRTRREVCPSIDLRRCEQLSKESSDPERLRLAGHASATTLWLSLALLGLTAAVYAPVRHHAFLNYDDNDYVTENAHVKAGLSRDSIVWAWTEPHSATWHPLTTLSHLLDCQLFGLHPGPPHVVNVVLHALSTLLLFGVLARMTGAAVAQRLRRRAVCASTPCTSNRSPGLRNARMS